MNLAERITNQRITFEPEEREDSLEPAEMKRRLTARAKAALEARGYGLQKTQGGVFLVVAYNPDDLGEQVLAEFDNIITLGQVFGLWGRENPNGDRDPDNPYLDTPTVAAIRES